MTISFESLPELIVLLSVVDLYLGFDLLDSLFDKISDVFVIVSLCILCCFNSLSNKICLSI
ncbi:unnamed protein product [Schistosoma margrebowiei]|uniref:Uncharacterized protein n=1 Tax=Schistosoma margrebowiei TaxID=48269 RepID=A0A3P8CF44_9TREM|nr:unnamed protein product [Schistosoma margrebowiei]